MVINQLYEKGEPLSLIDYLLSDLERYYHYNGQHGRVPKIRDIWRNFLIPRCAPVAIYRLSRLLREKNMNKTSKIMTWINFYFYGVEISSECSIGPYFYMPHAQGAVIGAAKIGSYAVIFHQVTIGATQVQFEHVLRPVIGDRVLISSGSKVLGNIEIGDDCKIGANSLVLSSMEPGSLAIGLEAKYSRIKESYNV